MLGEELYAEDVAAEIINLVMIKLNDNLADESTMQVKVGDVRQAIVSVLMNYGAPLNDTDAGTGGSKEEEK